MNNLPATDDVYSNGSIRVRVTRLTAVSGLYRWIYYRNIETDEFHCQRLDLFLKKYSK